MAEQAQLKKTQRSRRRTAEIDEFLRYMAERRTTRSVARAVATDKDRLPALLQPVLVDCAVRGKEFRSEEEIKGLAAARFGDRRPRRRLNSSRATDAKRRLTEMTRVEALTERLEGALLPLTGVPFLTADDAEPEYDAALGEVAGLSSAAKARCLEELARSSPNGLRKRGLKGRVLRLADRANRYPIGKAKKLYYALRSIRRWEGELTSTEMTRCFVLSALKAHLASAQGKVEIKMLAQEKSPEVYRQLVRRQREESARRRGQMRAFSRVFPATVRKSTT